MNIAQTTELAALIATHSKHIIESVQPLPEQALRDYWFHSRKQLLYWMNELNRLDNQQSLLKESEADAIQRDISVQTILEEIFITEILTRIWSALLSAIDQRHHLQYSEPVGRGVLLAHIQARHRALKILLEGHLSSVRKNSLNKLRRRCERWTDLMLGQLAPHYDINEYAFDPQRAYHLGTDVDSTVTHPMLLAGIRIAFSRFDFMNRQVSEHLQKVVSAILASFPPDAFQSSGTFRPLSNVRIYRNGGQESENIRSSKNIMGEQFLSSQNVASRFDPDHDNGNKLI